MLFHGSTQNGSQFEGVTLSQKADQAGFAVAYFDGLPDSSGSTSWNGYFNSTFGSNAPDASGFAQQLILTLVANLHPDPKKIYVTGSQRKATWRTESQLTMAIWWQQPLWSRAALMYKTPGELKPHQRRRPRFPCSFSMETLTRSSPAVGFRIQSDCNLAGPNIRLLGRDTYQLLYDLKHNHEPLHQVRGNTHKHLAAGRHGMN